MKWENMYLLPHRTPQGFNEVVPVEEAEAAINALSKSKLSIVEESLKTEAQLHKFAGEVISFISREYGEFLPGEHPEMEDLLTKAQKLV
jgi:hypothetical protein